jgi:uroporphyrinogen-III synthase
MKMKRRPNASGRRQQRANASSSSSKEEEKTEKTKVVVLTREAGKNEQMRKILASIEEDKDNEFVVETLEMPLVESKRNEEEAKKLVDLLQSKTFRWIIVTSPEAANVFAKAWADAGKPEGLNIGTVGGGTTRALPTKEEMKWASLFTPSKALGEVLAEELPLDVDGDNESSNSNSNREVLYPCSKKAAKTIENGLSSRGFIVTRLNTYSTEQVTNIPKEVLERAVDASVVTFGSPSAVKAWKSLTLELLEERGGKHPTYACIGQTSANACEDCELPDVWHPEDPGMEGWAEVVKLCLEQDESEKWRGVF